MFQFVHLPLQTLHLCKLSGQELDVLLQVLFFMLFYQLPLHSRPIPRHSTVHHLLRTLSFDVDIDRLSRNFLTTPIPAAEEDLGTAAIMRTLGVESYFFIAMITGDTTKPTGLLVPLEEASQHSLRAATEGTLDLMNTTVVIKMLLQLLLHADKGAAPLEMHTLPFDLLN
uniref:Uncharacterized protein n=1 Tax=Chromera velia CCMP2878 TaxID=1169474 RepID=A0A0G4FLK0_9ALVE|eukprot:Cvel_17555.t1-p1 / transcript=Cvel_17555.t1 / gene=Cvel_17555 / organism=Chromera_velia_CCMP2878 / gene_product=RING finger protein DG17, putative / transcript_product=RING finger protein DG17, putative / location=Cvel_scaffold1409:34942-35448(-) / protein_length=169 / sequence_SO=supercontig / SO=protein_coding / is_pseudo=false